MPNPNTASPAPAIAGTAGAPPAAGTSSPVSPVIPPSAPAPAAVPLSTASLSAAIGRQLSGEEYNLNPITPAPPDSGQEPSPVEGDAEHSADFVAGAAGDDAAADADGTDANDGTKSGGNPAFARLRIEAKEAKAKLMEVTAELERLKAAKPEPVAETPEPDTGLSMMDLPELRQATEAESTQRQVVQWVLKAVTRLERAQRNDDGVAVLESIRKELGDQATALPQDPNLALEWLDNLHAGAQDLLQAARVRKEVLGRELKQAASDVSLDSRQFAEAIMPAVFLKESPEAKMVADAKQLFPGIEKNPLFYTWVVKAIRGHQVIETELAAAKSGTNGTNGTNGTHANGTNGARRAVQVPGARANARLPGASSHLPARPAEAPVQGSSHWMAQMRAATTKADLQAAKAEWQKALALESGGAAVPA